jgi:hypothetical protein
LHPKNRQPLEPKSRRKLTNPDSDSEESYHPPSDSENASTTSTYDFDHGSEADEDDDLTDAEPLEESTNEQDPFIPEVVPDRPQPGTDGDGEPMQEITHPAVAILNPPPPTEHNDPIHLL